MATTLISQPFTIKLWTIFDDAHKHPKKLTGLYKKVGTEYTTNTLPVSYNNSSTSNEIYYLKQNSKYSLELRDSTNRVLWHKDYPNVKDIGSKFYNESPDSPLTIGKCIEVKGLVALADMDSSRYFLMDKEGHKTYLPVGTLGMESHGLVGGKYWMLTAGINIDYSSPEIVQPLLTAQTYFPKNKGIALFNLDGSLYTKIDLSKWHHIYNLQFSPAMDKIFFLWNSDQNDQYTKGMVLMQMSGDIIRENKLLYDDNSIMEWTNKGDLIYSITAKDITLYDGASGDIYAILTTSEGVSKYDVELPEVDKTTGLIFISDYTYLYVINYLTGNTLAIIPYSVSNCCHIELMKSDGSEFALTELNERTTYRLIKK